MLFVSSYWVDGLDAQGIVEMGCALVRHEGDNTIAVQNRGSVPGEHAVLMA
jgi:hypothetical protein